jgi:pimeloyl-ACP methyl ester carboxylesterase
MDKLIAGTGLAALLFLAGCGGSGQVGTTNLTSGNGNPAGATPVTPKATTAALFQPLQGILPFPTDLYFSGSTDGTLNIQPANALIPSQTALNALDGFSTTAVIRARFGGPLSPASLTAGSVIVIQVKIDNTTKATIGVVRPLVFGTDYTVGLGPEAGVGSSIVEIRPSRPLVPSIGLVNNGYLVLLTKGITDTSGNAATPDTDYANIKAALPTCSAITNTSLNGICRLTGAHLQIAQAAGINPADLVLSFSFTTQSISDAMVAVASGATVQPIAVRPTGLTTKQIISALPGIASVYVGTLRIPYYLSRTKPLTEFWHAKPSQLDASSTFVTRFNPVPVLTETLTIPVLMTVPNAGSPSAGVAPAGGWPIVIFQHGITGNRLNMLPIADAFANAGMAVIAIDMPLHGITDPTNPLYARNPAPATGSIERTFDLDLANNDTGAPGPDGRIDSSGSYFINLTSLLTSRDNLREAAADLITLAKSVPQIDLDGDGTPDVSSTQIRFVGHSLGGMTGTTFLAVTDTKSARTATLAMPGGGIASLLRLSPSFGPRIIAGLQQQGLQQGTTLFEQFFRDAQTVVDSGDPWNFMAAAAAAHPIHLIQVVGSTTSLPDQVISNFATQRLIDAGGLTKVSTTAVSTSGLRGYVNFTAGTHGSLLDPTASAAATAEMQRETVVFAASDGAQILVTNSSVVQP